MPIDTSTAHYAVCDRPADLTPAEHIDRASVKLRRADELDRIGHLYRALLSEAAGHLRAALRAVEDELEEWL